jgi:hypothetical protein
MSVDHKFLATALVNQEAAPLYELELVFGNVVAVVLGLAGILLFIMLLFGGYKYLTSGGDPKAVDSAQKTLTSAVAGLVLVALAYLILRFVNIFTGANVLNFAVWRPDS